MSAGAPPSAGTSVGVVVAVAAAGRTFRSARGEDVRALEDVRLEVRAGSFLAVTGPSGGGKSTLLSLVAALDRPTSGTVTHDGADLSTASHATLARLRRGVGIVFQSAPMLARLAVWENVTQGLVPAGVRAADRRLAAVAVLERLGLAGLADRAPEELSGGERQRAAVARALVASPRLIVADEPTSQLDEDSARLVVAALVDARSRGATVVAATHDPALVSAADAVLRLARGRVVTG